MRPLLTSAQAEIILYVARTTHGVSGTEARRVHLHDQSLVLLFPLLGVHGVLAHEGRGEDVDEAGEAGERIAPGQVVEVGIEKPVSLPAATAEDDDGEKQQES